MLMFGPWSPTINWLLAQSKYRAEGRELPTATRQWLYSIAPDGRDGR